MNMTRILVFFIVLLTSFNVLAQNSSRNVAIERAKAIFYATANGDVTKLKQLMTPDFYRKNYPYSDAKVREILLSIPIEKRKRLIDQIKNQSIPSTIINRAGDVITVFLTNKVTKKEITVQLVDENECGDWKVFNYWY